MEQIKQQVERLEWRVDLQDEQLKMLTANANELRGMLDSINRTLLQIKWLVVGGAVVYWSQSMGLFSALKILGV
jgi:prefoldin subunit 5